MDGVSFRPGQRLPLDPFTSIDKAFRWNVSSRFVDSGGGGGGEGLGLGLPFGRGGGGGGGGHRTRVILILGGSSFPLSFEKKKKKWVD